VAAAEPLITPDGTSDLLPAVALDARSDKPRCARIKIMGTPKFAGTCPPARRFWGFVPPLVNFYPALLLAHVEGLASSRIGDGRSDPETYANHKHLGNG